MTIESSQLSSDENDETHIDYYINNLDMEKDLNDLDEYYENFYD